MAKQEKKFSITKAENGYIVNMSGKEYVVEGIENSLSHFIIANLSLEDCINSLDNNKCLTIEFYSKIDYQETCV